jgi:hypothetical protein
MTIQPCTRNSGVMTLSSTTMGGFQIVGTVTRTLTSFVRIMVESLLRVVV